MWSVRDGRLYHGEDPVAVRRVIVEWVAGRTAGPLPDERARTMLRMERALSIRSVSRQLSEDPR
jgi:hypothetical protein